MCVSLLFCVVGCVCWCCMCLLVSLLFVGVCGLFASAYALVFVVVYGRCVWSLFMVVVCALLLLLCVCVVCVCVWRCLLSVVLIVVVLHV